MSRVIVIGGGASGLFAAINAARSGNVVTILEANDKMGRKILSTGNGKCNLSNTNDLSGKYHCNNEVFLKKIFEQFSNKDIIDEFNKMGLLIRYKNNYLYPASMQASSVVDLLISYCRLLKVKFVNNTIAYNIDMLEDETFNILTYSTKDKNLLNSITYLCDIIIISTGTKAGLKDSFCENLRDFLALKGHTFEEYKPSLCSLYVSKTDKVINGFFKNANGVRCNITARLFVNEKETNSSKGELQITDYGLSGIVIFQLSSSVSRALESNKKTDVVIDFLPDSDIDEITSVIKSQDYYEKKSLSDIFNGLLNNKLSMELINLYSSDQKEEIKSYSKNLSKDDLTDLISFIKNIKFNICKTNDYLHSQICCGGINTDEINPDTMESKLIKNLHFTGECINVDGECGGYNLQWAWSTGFIAGSKCRK